MDCNKSIFNCATIMAIIVIGLAEVTVLTGESQEHGLGHSATNCSRNCSIIDNEKLETKLVKAVEHLSSLICLNYVNITLSDSSSNLIHPNMWYWALGRKGQYLLTLPYDFRVLSFGISGHGISTEDVMLECDGDSNGSSIPAECVFETLSKLVHDVSLSVKIESEEYVSLDKSQLCQEYSLPRDIFYGVRIPGYSIYQLQARSNYTCHVKQPNQLVFRSDLDLIKEYNCKITGKVSFSLSVAIMLLVFAVWIVYPSIVEIRKEAQGDQRTSKCGTPSLQNEISIEEKTVNILNISVFLPIDLLWPDTSKRKNCLRKLFWLVVYLLPCIINMVLYGVYVHFEKDYWTRQRLFDEHMQYLLLDLILANALYVIGIILYCFLYKWVNKKIAWHIFFFKILVFILCAFRISALLWLLLELYKLIIEGIIINAEYIGPTSVNIISGVYVVLKTCSAFFDRYQRLFRNIYVIRTKIAQENSNQVQNNEENRQACDIVDVKGNMLICSQNTQAEVPYFLLQDIIRKHLPFCYHVTKTIFIMVVRLYCLSQAAQIVYFVESNTITAVLMEYVVAIVSSAAVASDRMFMFLYREKNLRQKELNTLTEYLRRYASEEGIINFAKLSVQSNNL